MTEFERMLRDAVTKWDYAPGKGIVYRYPEHHDIALARRHAERAACGVCGRDIRETLKPRNAYWPAVHARYCSNACRQKAYRQRVTRRDAARASRNEEDS